MTHENWYQEHREEVQADYLELLRFPSMSADPARSEDIRSCCNWVAAYLRKSGLEVEVWETAGHPTVFAQNLQAGAGKPTVLLYGHYDVQPVDPLDQWVSPPFEPRIENGKVFARGAQDNKGQLSYVLAALRSFGGKFPLNVKVCVEGEEEVGSGSLEKLLPKVTERLKADTLLVVDSGIRRLDSPSITLGVRGILTLSLRLRGSKTDLHSGLWGGVAYNPNHALVSLLAQLRSPEGRILVPGFYDGVKDLTPEERTTLSLDWDIEASKKQFGVACTGGEASYPPGERGGSRPTLEINGISGGYSGPGFKTVIPAVAEAKISCRLVPDQDPAVITKKVIEFLKSRVPPGVTLEIEEGHGGLPVRSRADSLATIALAKAFELEFGKPCEFALMGGSIPISSALSAAAGAHPLFCGLGLPDDNIHAPNEHFDLQRLHMGFHVICRFLQTYGSR